MPLREFTRFIWWMQTERQVAANPQTKPIDLGYESAGRKAAVIHIHHRHFIITQPKGWYSFYHPTEGGRLSRPRHCSKGAQPVPKAVYRSGCRDKHNRPRWDSNLGPLKPQSDALTTRPCTATLVPWLWINECVSTGVIIHTIIMSCAVSVYLYTSSHAVNAEATIGEVAWLTGEDVTFNVWCRVCSWRNVSEALTRRDTTRLIVRVNWRRSYASRSSGTARLWWSLTSLLHKALARTPSTRCTTLAGLLRSFTVVQTCDMSVMWTVALCCH